MLGIFKKLGRTTKEIEHMERGTAQGVIKYRRIYDDGIMEVEKGAYSKTIKFNDINYQIAKQSDQETIFAKYCDLLNYFDSNVEMQITINNKNIDMANFENDMLIKDKGDALDEYRHEYNEMLRNQISKGRNNITKEKMLTLKVRANNYNEAKNIFMRLESEVDSNIRAIGSNSIAMKGVDRLQTLSDFFNTGNEHKISDTMKEIKKKGLTSKDVIAPIAFRFKKDYFEMGNKYARAIVLKEMPTFLADNFIAELTDFHANLMLTINVKSLSPEKAFQRVERRLTSMNMNKMQIDRQAKTTGRTAFIPYELEQSLIEGEELLNDLKTKNQRLFITNLIIVHVADSLDELNSDTDSLISIGNKFVCKLDTLLFQQEEALNSVLPIGNNIITFERTLTTESTAILVPFTSQELCEKGGAYYGVNAVSRNIIALDRCNLKTPSGFILATSGAGKSFMAKLEIISRYLATADDVIVIDPQNEYSKLAEALGGSVINISSNTKNYINPLDMSKNYGDDGNPVQAKSDYFLSLVECLIGSNLTASEKSVLDRCLHRTYEKAKKGKIVPTLETYLTTLNEMDSVESKKLALELGIYVNGSLSLFSHETNINLDNRLTVFTTHDLGKQLKSVGMLVILDLIWNRITENHAKGKRTWIYIDEIYLLFNNELSSNFLFELYKKVRKWGGIPTGITQNIEDLLISEQARRMLSNSEFILMLNQAPSDRAEIAKLLNISDTQLSYVTNAGVGKGLICHGGGIVPFINEFPKNTKLYKLITTKPNETYD